jgi:hypothetical protein
VRWWEFWNRLAEPTFAAEGTAKISDQNQDLRKSEGLIAVPSDSAVRSRGIVIGMCGEAWKESPCRQKVHHLAPQHEWHQEHHRNLELGNTLQMR